MIRPSYPLKLLTIYDEAHKQRMKGSYNTHVHQTRIDNLDHTILQVAVADLHNEELSDLYSLPNTRIVRVINRGE